MDLQKTNNIFRLSATFYANNNYLFSPLGRQKKIIEDILYVQDKPEGLSVEQIAEAIEKMHGIAFTENEIKRVFNDPKYRDKIFTFTMDRTKQKFFLLHPLRRQTLSNRDPKTLDNFIDEYIALHKLDEESKEIIYRFLYSVYTSNIDSFRRLMRINKLRELTEIFKPGEREAEIINGFLDWEKDDKNKAMFNLASFALEYCLLTGKKSEEGTIEALRKKRFYLDTNIIYRALGINGEDRKNRTLSFLHKLKESENEIKVTRFSWKEFHNSFDNYISRLRKSEVPAVNSRIYSEYVVYDDLYCSYHRWASKKANPTIDIFVATLKTQLDKLKDDFKIEIDEDAPFKMEECKEKLNENSAVICEYSRQKFFESAFKDACNIYWVEKLRKPGENDLFSAKTFLLSSDWGLYTWDSKVNSKGSIPKVITPSQWLSVYLRYVTRSNDDFKSFVSFLNIRNSEGELTPEEINEILVGISEITTDLESQKELLKYVIDTEFKEGVRNKVHYTLKEVAKKAAKRKYQEKLEVMVKEKEAAYEEIEKMKEEKNQVLRENEYLKSSQVRNDQEQNQKRVEIERRFDELLSQETELRRSAEEKVRELEEREASRKKKKRVNRNAFMLFIMIGLFIWYLLSTPDSPHIMGNFLKFIDESTDSQKEVWNWAIKGFFLTIFSLIGNALSKDIFGISLQSLIKREKSNPELSEEA